MLDITLDPGSYSGTYEAETGIPCLDFANTISWRTSDHPHDWLDSYSNLVAWGRLSGALADDEAKILLEKSSTHPGEASLVLDRAVALREAIYGIFSAFSAQAQVQASDLDALNQELQIAYDHLRVASVPDEFVWEWFGEPDSLDRMLWTVAHSAVELLMSEELDRVGECQGDGCGWLFLDTSKNHSRRWCDMNGCGNRAKARKHYRRKKAKESGKKR